MKIVNISSLASELFLGLCLSNNVIPLHVESLIDTKKAAFRFGFFSTDTLTDFGSLYSSVRSKPSTALSTSHGAWLKGFRFEEGKR